MAPIHRLTLVRVMHASVEDLRLVAAMNRIRAEYVAMDPSIANVLRTGARDDRVGVLQTYSLGARSTWLSSYVASAVAFISAVNSIVAAAVGAVVADAFGTPGPVAAVAAVLTAALYFTAAHVIGEHAYTRGL